jgi:hypothetical protein|tara:strand:- start:242 stop:469 length:228 start_codon:yes stop_codon:yes gene_type:complete
MIGKLTKENLAIHTQRHARKNITLVERIMLWDATMSSKRWDYSMVRNTETYTKNDVLNLSTSKRAKLGAAIEKVL